MLLPATCSISILLKIPTISWEASPIETLGSHLDHFILLTGDYECAAKAASKRLCEIAEYGNLTTVIHAGTALAAVSNPEMIDAFTVSSRHFSQCDRLLLDHRTSIAYTKRLNQPQEGLHRFRLIIEEAKQCDPHGDNCRISQVQALARNGIALVLNQAGDFLRTVHHLEQAIKLLDTTKNRALSENNSETNRYLAQFRINLAQVHLSFGAKKLALSYLQENLEHCKLHATDYVGEALSALAYLEYLRNQYSNAVNHSMDALRLRVANGELAASKTLLAIIAASSEKLGHRVLSNYCISMLNMASVNYDHLIKDLMPLRPTSILDSESQS